MTNDKKQRLGIQDWDDEKVEMFESVIDILSSVDRVENSISHKGFITKKTAILLLSKIVIRLEYDIFNLTGKTFEEIQTIMEGEGT